MGQQVAKQKLREQARTILNRIDDSKLRSEKISNEIIDLIQKEKPETILMYYPTVNEVDITSVFEYCWAKEIKTYSSHIQNLFIGEVRSFNDFEEICEYKQPKSIENNLTEIDFAIVPGLLFTKLGDRLGQGKGWYDRFFELYKVKKIIGVCFTEQIVQELPIDENDVKMDYIVFG